LQYAYFLLLFIVHNYLVPISVLYALTCLCPSKFAKKQLIVPHSRRIYSTATVH